MQDLPRSIGNVTRIKVCLFQNDELMTCPSGDSRCTTSPGLQSTQSVSSCEGMSRGGADTVPGHPGFIFLPAAGYGGARHVTSYKQ